MAISIPIISEFSPKGIQAAIKEFQRLETSGQKAQFAIRKAALPAAAALAGLAAAATVSVKAAIEDQRSQVELARTLRATIGATDGTVRAVERQIAAMEAASGIADDQLRPAYAALLRGTNDVSKATDGLSLALDISAATGRSVEDVSNALSMAYGGNMRGLRQLSPAMFKMIKDGASMDEVFKSLAATFGGAMAENANTVEGRMRRLNVALDNAQENIGYALLPVLERLLPYLERFGNWAQTNTGTILKVAGAVAALAAAILAMKVLITVNAALAVFGTSFVALAGPIGIAVGALVAFKIQLDRMETHPVFDPKSRFGLNFGNFLSRLTSLPGVLFTAVEGLKVLRTVTSGGGVGAPSGTAQQGLAHLQELGSEAFKTGSAIAGLGVEADKTFGGGAAATVESYSSRFKTALEGALDSAKGRLEDVRGEMVRFGDGVRDALLGAFGFGDALDAGKETGGGFLAGLQAQADRVLEYSSQINQLLDLGLSREALQEVLAAGTEAGSEIAKQLIEGGAAAIAETNRLVESAQAAATNMGVLAGEKYFGAGVTFAQRVVDGLQERLDKLTPALMAKMDSLAKKLGRTVDVNVRVNRVVGEITAGAGSPIPALAEGGIVTRPTIALIGEAGPEAVVPLSRMGQQQQGGGSTTINIYSTLADESLPEKLVQALRTYNRTTGPVRIQVV